MSSATAKPIISVVVPVYNEERALPAFLAALSTWEDLCLEVIFVDGGSRDATRDVLAGQHVITSVKGRGAQCACGVAATSGSALLFLHADSIVKREAVLSICSALEHGVRWGCLTQRYDKDCLMYRLGLLLSNMRARLAGVPFGDQALFMQRSILEQVGGFPELSLMEDYELSRRLRRLCWPKQLPQKVITSARRFEQGGRLKVGLSMWRLRAQYRRGVPIEEIERAYRDVREADVRSGSGAQTSRRE